MSWQICTVEIREKDSKHVKTSIAIYGPNKKEIAEIKVTEEVKGNMFIVKNFNRNVGQKDHTHNKCLGIQAGETRNSHGKRMLYYCIMHNLIVTNTLFQHYGI